MPIEDRSEGRTISSWRALLIAGLLTLALGCGRQEPAPTDVARSFAVAIDRLASGADGAALSAYGLLSPESQATFIEQAMRTNDALPPNLPRLEPHQLLRVRRSHVGPQDEFVEVERSDARAVVEIRRGDKSTRLELVKQPGGWRISLLAPIPTSPSELPPKPRQEGEAG